MPARRTVAFRACANRSIGWTPTNEPFFFPRAVRTASTMTAVCMVAPDEDDDGYCAAALTFWRLCFTAATRFGAVSPYSLKMISAGAEAP